MSNKSVAGASHKTTQPQGAMAPRGRITVQMVQNVLLIWLDGNVDENNSDCRNTITQLRRSMNTINIFTDSEECLQFLKDMQDEKSCMIISGALGQQIVPRIHDLAQVDTIFIFCGNKKYHEQWAKNWSKIKGVFTEITPICEALKTTAKQCEQDAISMSFMATSGGASQQEAGSTGSIVYVHPNYQRNSPDHQIRTQTHPGVYQILSRCLRRQSGRNEQYSRSSNGSTATKHPSGGTPVNVFCTPCSIVPYGYWMEDIIVQMGFFISDLHRHIVQLHQEQFGGASSNTTFKVYRGQGMLVTEFEKLQQTKGGLLSFNNFLSTSKKREVSMDFAQRGSTNSDMVGILFVMTIDPAQSTTPFASINDVSYFGEEEDEVLFRHAQYLSHSRYSIDGWKWPSLPGGIDTYQ